MTDLARPSDDYRKVAVIGLGIIVATFGVMGLWAAFTPLNSAAIGHGTVVIDSNRQTIQHYEGGIVRQILVHEGDHVNKGQTLFQLDSVQANATLDIARNQLFSLLAKGDRLRAEQEDKPTLVFSPEVIAAKADPIVSEAMADEMHQFIERRATLQGQTEVLKSRVSQYEIEIQGIDQQRAAAQQQVAFLDDEISGLNELYKKDLVPKPRLLALQRERAQLLGAIGQNLSDKARAYKAIGETKLQIVQIHQQFQQDVSKDAAEVQTQATDIRQRFTVAKDQAKRVTIVAPMSGTIQNLHVFTEGAVVRQAEPLVDIAPDQGHMNIQARFSPNDVDSLHIGQKAQLRFSTFHSRTIPVIEGTIATISQDRLVDDATHQPYYLATIRIKDTKLPPELDGKLRAGFPADVTVPTEARSALQYIYEPLTGAFHGAFREK